MGTGCGVVRRTRRPSRFREGGGPTLLRRSSLSRHANKPDLDNYEEGEAKNREDRGSGEHVKDTLSPHSPLRKSRLDENAKTIIMNFVIHAHSLLLSDALGLIIGRGLSCMGGRTL
jgi:hypothetical protein